MHECIMPRGNPPGRPFERVKRGRPPGRLWPTMVFPMYDLSNGMNTGRGAGPMRRHPQHTNRSARPHGTSSRHQDHRHDVGAHGTIRLAGLGDMGADVVKVESPHGDLVRQIGPARHDGMGRSS